MPLARKYQQAEDPEGQIESCPQLLQGHLKHAARVFKGWAPRWCRSVFPMFSLHTVTVGQIRDSQLQFIYPPQI